MGGERNLQDGLWDIKFTQQPLQANIIVKKNMKKKDLIVFLHACCFSPTHSTFIKAVQNGNFITWLGLTPELIKKYLPVTIVTQKRHMKQERQHLQSTKKVDCNFPTQDTPNIKCNDVIYALYEPNKKYKAYGDLTGKFPLTCSRGTKYFLIAYHYDVNAILAIGIKNRTAAEITNAYMAMHKKFNESGNAPNTWVLDNKVSSTLLDAFSKSKLHISWFHPM